MITSWRRSRVAIATNSCRRLGGRGGCSWSVVRDGLRDLVRRGAGGRCRRRLLALGGALCRRRDGYHGGRGLCDRGCRCRVDGGCRVGGGRRRSRGCGIRLRCRGGGRSRRGGRGWCRVRRSDDRAQQAAHQVAHGAGDRVQQAAQHRWRWGGVGRRRRPQRSHQPSARGQADDGATAQCQAAESARRRRRLRWLSHPHHPRATKAESAPEIGPMIETLPTPRRDEPRFTRPGNGRCHPA